MLKNFFKRGYEEIRDRKLLEILKKEELGNKTVCPKMIRHWVLNG
jgi:hypothetical protein